MKQLTHGGDWAGYRAEFGRDPLDFSANVSPLGLPGGVAKAITASLATADRYPDPLCRALREKLAVAEGVPAEWLLCGNGAADLIFRLALAEKPRTALVTAPTFAEYATALGTVDCRVERHFLREENDFAVTDAILDAVHPGIDLVFLCQPNNPTGQLARPALVEALLRRCEAVGAVLAVDECFLDFLPEGQSLSAKRLLSTSRKLIILKAFTKLYGMAGVRLGGGPAVGGVRSGAGGRHCRAGRDGICGAGARIDRNTAACAGRRPAGAGPAGDRGPGQLSAVPGTGSAGRCAAAQGRGAAQLRQLSGSGRRLVPHRRAHRE